MLVAGLVLKLGLNCIVVSYSANFGLFGWRINLNTYQDRYYPYVEFYVEIIQIFNKVRV